MPVATFKIFRGDNNSGKFEDYSIEVSVISLTFPLIFSLVRLFLAGLLLVFFESPQESNTIVVMTKSVVLFIFFIIVGVGLITLN